MFGEDTTPLLTLPEGTAEFHAYSLLYLDVIEATAVWTRATFLGTDVILLVAGPSEPWTVPAGTLFTPDVKGMTQETVYLYQYAMLHTREETLDHINHMSRGHSVIAYDMEGNVLAMIEVTLGSEKINWLNQRDVYDVPTIRNMVYLAQQGGGYLLKYDSATAGEPPRDALLYLIYVMPIDDSWFIMLRTPANAELSPVHSAASWNVSSLARNTTFYAWEAGKDAVIADINSGSSRLLAAASGNITDFAAVDMNGTVLANAFVPGDVGKNLFWFTDATGTSVGQQYVLSAKGGGGLIYHVLAEPDDPSRASIRLMCVEPIDDTWFIITGVELEVIARTDPMEMMP